MLQRQLDVDILISGHTHQLETYEYDGHYFINPGSATGALTPSLKNLQPSFVLLDIEEAVIQIYVYTLVDDVPKISKTEYRKEIPMQSTCS
ncbi:unnamed protein product [Calicophoron daubneyi]